MKTQIDFKSFDGTVLNGILSIPDNQNTKGVFLLMHGIPSGKDEWGFYTDMANTLLANGYASFRFDFRYNGNVEPQPMTELTLSGLLTDIEAAYRMIKERYCDKKVYVVGTSCGGGVTVKWLNTFKHEIEICFLMAPVLDYVYETIGITRNEFLEEGILPPDALKTIDFGYFNQDIKYGTSFFDDAIVFDGKSELNFCKNKIIIMQGTKDTVVPISITKQMIADLPIKLIEIPEADHGFAVDGDDYLTFPETKQNHHLVYQEIIKELDSVAE